MQKRLMTLLACMVLAIGTVFAQRVVKGSVISQEDGQPIIGATVKVVGTKVGTSTDADGNFSINCPDGKKITVSYVGMTTQTVLAKPGMTVALASDEQLLGTVVVTGMQKTDRRLFTGATNRIDADEARLNGVADISRSLEGRAAGVSVQNVSGTFGSAPKIRVRGATSIYGSSKPLWVVDGVIMEDVSDVSADDLASGNPETLISSAIAGLNSDDIETFQILKDGSATSIYGARAMAGVIVVTTKKGKKGQAHINYTGEFTMRMIPSYGNFNILNSQEQMGIYKEMQEKGWLNMSSVLNGSDYGVYGKMYELMNTYDTTTGQYAVQNTQEGRYGYLRQAEMRNTDWFKELFSTGIQQNHSVSMSGGTEKSNYYVSMSAMLDPGWYKKSKVERYTANFNATHYLLPNLNINFIGSASYRKQQAPGTLGQDVDVVSGQVKRDFDINPYSYALNSSRALDPNETYVANYAPFNIKNELENNYIDLNVVDTKFQLELKYKPIPELELSLLGAIKYASTSQEHNIKDNSNQAMAYRAMDNSLIRDANNYLYTDPDDPTALPITVLPQGGFYQRTQNSMLNRDFRFSANYNKTFNRVHIVNVFGGMETTDIKRNRNFFNGVGMQFDSGEIPFFVYKFFKKLLEDNGNYYSLTNTTSRSAAFFANATYSFGGRYTLNGTIRYEGSNQMGRSSKARWLPTWNIAGSWNAHEEEFFKQQNVLSHATFRASYSLTATPPDPAYSNSTVILKANTPWRLLSTDKETGLAVDDLANDMLTYEKKHELNLGLDLGFLGDRISATFDIYWRKNFDEIGPVSTMGVGGQIIRYGNMGKMKANGQEFSLATTNIKTRDFSWQTNFIFSHNTTEITDLLNQSRVIDMVSGHGFAMEGYPVRALFSIPYLGLDSNGLPVFENENGQQTNYDINFQERDKTSYLKYEGSTDPTFNGSLGNTFNYKGFSLNVFMTYAFGGVVRLDPVFRANYNDMTSMTKDFINRWAVPGDENITRVPTILDYRSYYDNRQLRYGYNAYNYTSDRTAKGDFIRMKEISLAYSFPKSWISAAHINNLSLKFQATNLFLIYADKKLNGQDPEFVNAGGVAAPLPKQFTLTLKIGM